MKWGVVLIFSIMSALPAISQVKFRTVVPQHAIAPGESFQVQYILENADQISNFIAPTFQGFRVVSGPNVYSSNGISSQKNLLFTLAAINEGRFKIRCATCVVNGVLVKSNEAFVQVLSPEDSGESPYFLSTGEDPYKKIEENLFLKLTVDKQSCFIGEPLVASFKLYSRLQSRSNVIKNPGFYGFSVYDMAEVNDQRMSEEKLNGHWFQVHTIRKVQLYPLQAGSFTIDAMEVANDVEFSRSVVNRKTEQEITENMYGRNEAKNDEDATAEIYKVNLKTKPVVINVRSLPHKNAADTFAGAVGTFSIMASVEKDSLDQNEETFLNVIVSGSGNFQRVNAPIIHWPGSFDTFEPLVTDTLSAQLVPLTGRRTFNYPFISNQSGAFTIGAIPLSFFDVRSHSYKTVSTKPISVFVKAAHTVKTKRTLNNGPSKTRNVSTMPWMVGAAFVLILVTFFLGRNIIRRNGQERPNPSNGPSTSITVSIDEALKQARLFLDKRDADFYRQLNMAIWHYLKEKFHLSGSQMNKDVLRKTLLAKRVIPDVIDSLLVVIHQSEIGTYTDAHLGLEKKVVFEKARDVLEAIEQNCS